jgi:hypothetical protein
MVMGIKALVVIAFLLLVCKVFLGWANGLLGKKGLG